MAVSSSKIPFVTTLSASNVLKESVSPSSETTVSVFMVASQITPFTIEAFGEQAKVMPVHKAIAARFNLFMFLFLIEVVQEDCNTFQRFLRLVLDLDGKLDLSLGYATQICQSL